MCLVGQPIHERVGQHLIGEEPHPVTGRSVRGYDDAPGVVPFGDDLVKRLGLFVVEDFLMVPRDGIEPPARGFSILSAISYPADKMYVFAN